MALEAVTLTPEAVEAINRARTALKSVSIYATTPEEGRIVALVEVAHDALFMVLNHAQAFGVVELTDDQVHNRA